MLPESPYRPVNVARGKITVNGENTLFFIDLYK